MFCEFFIVYFCIQTDMSQFPFLNTIWIVRPLWEVILKTVLFLPIIIGGIIGNVTLLTIVAKYSRLRTPTNLLIASMAGIDLINLILCPWMLLIHHFFQNYILGTVGCKTEGFLSGIFNFNYCYMHLYTNVTKKIPSCIFDLWSDVIIICFLWSLNCYCITKRSPVNNKRRNTPVCSFCYYRFCFCFSIVCFQILHGINIFVSFYFSTGCKFISHWHISGKTMEKFSREILHWKYWSSSYLLACITIYYGLDSDDNHDNMLFCNILQSTVFEKFSI